MSTPAQANELAATPRTDAKVLSWYNDPKLGVDGVSIQGRVVLADFARELERELAPTLAALAKAQTAASAQSRRDSFDLQAINRIVADQTKMLREQLASAEADMKLAREDTKRLDWLEKQKAEYVGHWRGGDGLDGPSTWQNPLVEWRVSQSAEHGTYSIPEGLSKLTIREAIDAALAALDKERAP